MPTFTEVKDLLGGAAAKVAGAKAANADDALTPEEKKTRIDGLLAEAAELKARAVEMRELEKMKGEIANAANAEAGAKTTPAPSGFKTFGDFLHSLWWELNPKNRLGPDPRLASLEFRDEAKAGPETKDLTEGTGAAGGFLVPAEDLATLQAVPAE